MKASSLPGPIASFLVVLGLWCAGAARAAPRASSNYDLNVEVINSAGAASASAGYDNVGDLGSIGAALSSAGFSVAGGFAAASASPDPTVTLATTNVAANAAGVTLTGADFDAVTPGNNKVLFNNGAAGTVTAATTALLTVTFTTAPTSAGPLTAVVTTDGQSSGSAVQVATITPVVISSTTNVSITGTTLTINGFGFDPTTTNNTVALSDGAVGTVTAATSTTLTITLGTLPAGTGPITAIVTTNGESSGSAVQVDTVITPDYTVTTSANALVVTQNAPNSDTIAISEPSAGNILFTTAGRNFSVNGTLVVGSSGALSLTSINSITLNAAAGNDTINIGAFTGALPSLTVSPGSASDTVNLNGSLTFNANASLNLDFQTGNPTAGADVVNVAANANILTSGSGAITVKVSQNIAMAPGSSFQTVNGGITLEANQQGASASGNFEGVGVNGARIIASGTGVVSVKGKGGNTGSRDVGVHVQAGGEIIGGTTGTMTVSGTGGPGNVVANEGIRLEGSGSSITSGGADVSVTGLADGTGTSNANYGVDVYLGAILSAGASGNVTVMGTGAANLSSDNYGVNLQSSGSQITSNGGNVSVTGINGGTGAGAVAVGVSLDSASLSAGGSGTVTLIGTGDLTSAGVGVNIGIDVRFTASITSAGGNMRVMGTAGSASSTTLGEGSGIRIFGDGLISAGGSGTATVTGTGGAGATASAQGVFLSGQGHNSNLARIGAANGAVTLTAITGSSSSVALLVGTNNTGSLTTGSNNPVTIITNSADIGSSATISSGTGPTTIKTQTAGTLINVGGADVLSGSPLTLGLTDAELDQVTAGTLNIGDSSSGAITVSAVIARSAVTNLNLTSGSTLSLNSSLNSDGGNVTFQGTSVNPMAGGTDVSMGTGTLAFGAGSSLAFTVGGTTVDSGYTQLNVAGQVNLTGVSLSLSGAYTPVGGETFTLVNNEGPNAITSAFAGLPEGALITGFLGSPLNARISYSGGDGNDVVLTVLSSDATLSGLTTTAGGFSPAFASGTTSYAATVPNTTASLTLTPTATQANASIMVNTVTVLSGSASASIGLSVGPNTITILVTAQDGTTTQPYTLTITRLPPPIVTLSTAPLVANATIIGISGSNFDSTAANNTVIFNDGAVGTVIAVMGTSFLEVSFTTGPASVGPLTAVVTTPVGNSGAPVEVAVVILPSADATLSSLAISSGALSPAFASGTISYTASVPDTVTSITVTPAATQAGASITVNGAAVVSGSPASIALGLGSNTIATLVTAQDGITKVTYTLVVTQRERPSLVVTTAADVTADDGLTSLREAIAYANGNGLTNAISFDPVVFAAPQTITLLSALPDVGGALSITGPAAGVTISGGSAVKIFKITQGSVVTLNGLTLSNGLCTGSDAGAGIQATAATVTLNACTLNACSATQGGAIYNQTQGGLTSTLALNRCTLNANTASHGAAIFNDGSGGTAAATLVNCTVYGNTGTFDGSLVNYANGGVAAMTTRFCTISANMGIKRCGVYNWAPGTGAAIFTTADTIFSNTNGANIINFSPGGSVVSKGNNLSSDPAGGSTTTTTVPGGLLNAVGDKRNTNARLGVLLNNGGPVQTAALLAGSPAINAGLSAGAPPTDARNFARPTSGRVDIGAFESGAAASPPGVFETVAAFANTAAGPNGPLVRNADGTIWGTTALGGLANQGTIWKLNAGGVFTTVAELGGVTTFNAKGGGGVSRGFDGSLYVTTTGGATGAGSVMRMSPDGALSPVQSSTGAYTAAQMVLGSDGYLYGGIKGMLVKIAPTGGIIWSVKLPAGVNLGHPLLEWLDGSFYGTSAAGGSANLGVIFKLTRTGQYTVVKDFTGASSTGALGSLPSGALITGHDGALYGVTAAGGTSGTGTVFRITSTGFYRTAASFPATAGKPGNILLGADGSYYGTLLSGAFGGIYKMTSGGALSALLTFTGTAGTAPGAVTAGTMESLVWGQDGVLYGSTGLGGSANGGVVFSLTPAGGYTVLRHMAAAVNDPEGAVAEDSAGNHFGTHRTGGTGAGSIFMVTADGAVTNIFAFNGANGSLPQGGLTGTADGNFYGTTSTGGSAGSGTLFRMAPGGAVTTLFSFTGTAGSHPGASPLAPLTAAPDGSLYGTTSAGGASGLGTVFHLASPGSAPVHSVVMSFTGRNGSNPVGGVAMDAAGDLLGTTRTGGAAGRGTVFRIASPATASPVFTLLTSFTGINGPAPGNSPQANLIQGSDGRFYGTTVQGGTSDAGTVFRISTAGVFELVTSFTNASGAAMGGKPGGLAPGPDGLIYGVTAAGGGAGNGVIFAINPASKAYAARAQFNGGALGSQGRGLPLLGADGNLYGITSTTLWRMTFAPQPTAKTLPATAFTSTSATLNGTVNANGMDAVVQFEFGSTTAYGTTLDAVPATASGTADIPVSLPVFGLQPHTVHHYRIVATAGASVVAGADQTLTTLNTAPEAASDTLTTSTSLDITADPLPDEDGDLLDIDSVAPPAAGALARINATDVQYTPAAALATRGYDQFIYHTSDGSDISPPALLTILYQPPAGLPPPLPADAVVLPTPEDAYAAWAATALPASVVGADRLAGASPALDGISNGLKCLMGLSPTRSDVSPFVVDLSGNPAFSQVRYPRQKALVQGFETLEESADGITWQPVAHSRMLVKQSTGATTDAMVITIYPVPGTPALHQFRLTVAP